MLFSPVLLSFSIMSIFSSFTFFSSLLSLYPLLLFTPLSSFSFVFSPLFSPPSLLPSSSFSVSLSLIYFVPLFLSFTLNFPFSKTSSSTPLLSSLSLFNLFSPPSSRHLPFIFLILFLIPTSSFLLQSFSLSIFLSLLPLFLSSHFPSPFLPHLSSHTSSSSSLISPSPLTYPPFPRYHLLFFLSPFFLSILFILFHHPFSLHLFFLIYLSSHFPLRYFFLLPQSHLSPPPPPPSLSFLSHASLSLFPPSYSFSMNLSPGPTPPTPGEPFICQPLGELS